MELDKDSSGQNTEEPQAGAKYADKPNSWDGSTEQHK